MNAPILSIISGLLIGFFIGLAMFGAYVLIQKLRERKLRREIKHGKNRYQQFRQKPTGHSRDGGSAPDDSREGSPQGERNLQAPTAPGIVIDSNKPGQDNESLRIKLPKPKAVIAWVKKLWTKKA